MLIFDILIFVFQNKNIYEKCLEMTFVVICRYINKTELNQYFKNCHCKKSKTVLKAAFFTLNS